MKTWPRRVVLTDLIARTVVGALFLLLSMNLLADFMRTGHVTGLLLLVSESLVVVLTVVRRRAALVDRSVAAGSMTLVSLVGPPLLRAGGVPSLAPDALTAVVGVVGLCIVIMSKVTLGRSFGLVPANRGVVVQGPYNVVRHPIYAGYLIMHIAFLVANPRLLNIAIVLVGDTALVVRALIEERVLRHDATYEAYCRRVGWHLVPGVF